MVRGGVVEAADRVGSRNWRMLWTHDAYRLASLNRLGAADALRRSANLSLSMYVAGLAAFRRMRGSGQRRSSAMEPTLKKKIEDALRAACAPAPAIVLLEDAGSDRVGGQVVSTAFDGLRPSQRQDLIWKHLDAALTAHEVVRSATRSPSSRTRADLEAPASAGLAKVRDRALSIGGTSGTDRLRHARRSQRATFFPGSATDGARRSCDEGAAQLPWRRRGSRDTRECTWRPSMSKRGSCKRWPRAIRPPSISP